MDISGKTIEQIVKEKQLSKEETKWFEQMISMMMCLRKYERLKEYCEKQNKTQE